MIKRVLFSFSMLLMLSSFGIQAAGISFFKGNWAEVLQTAKVERKLIFVDAYTVWCGPCKAMNRNTFPNDKVGTFFNKNFVNYKLDMEKGEGLEFARKYQVAAYPTLLFINPDGEVVHKILGYQAPNELLREGTKANDPARNPRLVAAEYKAGSKEPLILYYQAYHLQKKGKDFKQVAGEYFATQSNKNLLSEQSWKAIQQFTFDLDSREYQYLLKKQKKYIARYGLQPTIDKIYAVMKQGTIAAGLRNRPADFEAVKALARKRIKDKGMTANRLHMTFAETTKDWDTYLERARYHFDNYVISRPKDLDRAASIAQKYSKDPKVWEEALAWSRQSVALENGDYNNATYARLALQLGRFEEARRYAHKALQITTLNNDDPRALERLLKEIRQAEGR
ncbi:MAG: thioredoxin fold domain-containing protein [Bacteroidota bacterium]